jgi:hypothetical protein
MSSGERPIDRNPVEDSPGDGIRPSDEPYGGDTPRIGRAGGDPTEFGLRGGTERATIGAPSRRDAGTRSCTGLGPPRPRIRPRPRSPPRHGAGLVPVVGASAVSRALAVSKLGLSAGPETLACSRLSTSINGRESATASIVLSALSKSGVTESGEGSVPASPRLGSLTGRISATAPIGSPVLAKSPTRVRGRYGRRRTGFGSTTDSSATRKPLSGTQTWTGITRTKIGSGTLRGNRMG